MADIFSIQKRREIMARIRSVGTEPETRVYAILRDILGGRRKIETNVTALPGRPDIVIPSLRLVILVDGCFYHSCPKHGHQPKSNEDYWGPKLARNVKQARSNTRRLRALGFSVWHVWEHDLKGKANQTKTQNRLRTILQKRQ